MCVTPTNISLQDGVDFLLFQSLKKATFSFHPLQQTIQAPSVVMRQADLREGVMPREDPCLPPVQVGCGTSLGIPRPHHGPHDVLGLDDHNLGGSCWVSERQCAHTVTQRSA